MDNSYIIKDSLYYTVDDQYFIDNGYTDQKLFASDVPYYYKEIGERIIWCRQTDKHIFIADWYGFLTTTILNYFIQYRNSKNVKYTKIFDFHYLTLRLNRETGEIFNKTHDIMIGNSPLIDDTHELVLLIEQTNKILDEINTLTNNFFIKK